MSSYIIAIDQGTTSTRVCIFDENGHLVNQAQKEFTQFFPKPGWVEHDPEEIWQTTLTTLREATSKINKQQIVTIGITNQRETVLVWDAKSSKPIHPAIVWQCRRTQEACNKIRKRKLDQKIYKETGLIVDPYFSATKIQWILKNVSGAMARAKQGQLRLGTIDTFLLWRLSAGKAHGTDVSNASRTMLMNLKTMSWSPNLLKLFDVPESLLPEIHSSNALFGVTQGLGFLPDGIPIHGILGDQQAALFGQIAHSPGDAKCTFGTGSFILLNTGSEIVFSRHKLLTTVAWQLEHQKTIYALEGGVFICGAAVQWLRDGLGLIQSSEEIESLARQVSSSEGVEFVPALVGLGAPIWNPEARGLISGLTRGTNKAHIAFATLEAMALQNVDILRAMEKDLEKQIRQLKVDGGAAKNNLLMQLQSDYLGRPVDRPVVFETTALGAALMAGLGAGVFKTPQDLKKKWLLDRQFVPQISKLQREKRQRNWQRALQMVQL
jgi:glycerol kinase